MMKTTKGFKVHGLRKAVGELLRCPKGFHMEVWSEKRRDGSIEIWTSEYLSQNSWTVNHPEGERCLSPAIREMEEEACIEGIRLSMTAVLKDAVDRVWA